ncbi:MAG: hypothetical protein CME32_24280 [Gimesia sp.]|jgi:hypothetical protein|nr:hypothetical protein [Gimesia sp.]
MKNPFSRKGRSLVRLSGIAPGRSDINDQKALIYEIVALREAEFQAQTSKLGFQIRKNQLRFQTW